MVVRKGHFQICYSNTDTDILGKCSNCLQTYLLVTPQSHPCLLSRYFLNWACSLLKYQEYLFQYKCNL